MPQRPVLFALLALGLVPAAVLGDIRWDPPYPTADDPLRIIHSGIWGNSCVPRPVGVQVIDDVIRVQVQTPPGVGCLSAIDSFIYTADVPPLPRGDYQIEIWLRDLNRDPDAQPVLLESRSVHIRSGEGYFLLQDRFQVTVTWQDKRGRSGVGLPTSRFSRESLPLFFFSPDNLELIVKVLDGCGLNGHFWVFTSAATTVEYTVEIFDPETFQVWTYTNPQGERSRAVADILAFPCGS